MVDLQARMLNAILDGQGLRGVAELAAAEAGVPVAIVLPARGLSVAADDDSALDELTAFVAKRMRATNGSRPADVVGMEPVVAGGEEIGYVVALRREDPDVPGVALDVGEVLRTAALAAITEIAVLDARDELADEIRGTLLDDLRAGRARVEDVVRRASRLGCDLGHGAVALVAEVRSSRPLYAAALIRSEHPGAIAEVLAPPPRPAASGAGKEPLAPRVYAILPAGSGADGEERALASAKLLARRLRPHGPAAFSSVCGSAAEVGRAISEAELALEVVSGDERMAEQLANGMGNGVYRLLFRALASEPGEVRLFYEETVEPLTAHDLQYRTDLIGTLEAYLDNDGNMNATARALYAHRHTVAHRLGRVRELTGLDPAVSEDRERLGLGLKAYRILAPTLSQ
jgi:PucR C-terminal helix-turn-helix domain/GGDEF-like domain